MHDDLEEHWHFYDEGAEGYTSEEIDGIERFTQHSVGIDIGSSTSHLIFSELVLRRELSSGRFLVTDRRTLHRSAIFLTPYSSPTQIDADRLKGFIDRTYHAAGVKAEEVDAGAVVITGEALNKENARPILDLFSGLAGKFICASAGPNHEAILAANGSGAVAMSHDNHWDVLLVDIGGGTTKFALVEDGEITQTAAMSIGARLIAVDADGRATRIEDAARLFEPSIADLALGDAMTPDQLRSISERMVESLFEVILGQPLSDLTQKLFITDLMPTYGGIESIDRVVFSGGVSEYVYGREEVSYGDLGLLLGHAIRHRFNDLGLQGKVAPSASGIRATVVGAAEYTVQASGNTSYISNRSLLPMYGLQVVKPHIDRIEDLSHAILDRLAMFDLPAYGPGLALALSLAEELSYPYLRKTCDGVLGAMPSSPPDELVIVIDKDVAKTIGAILKEELGFAGDLVILDGIEVGYLDYLDVGEPMGTSSATSDVLAVMVKSLVFPQRPAQD